MSDKYILKGKELVVCNDLMEWAKWFENADRHVAKDKIDGVKISTVFLGLDYSFGSGPPLLFETMVFGGKYDQDQERYPTWDEAIKGHKKMVQKVKESKQ